MAIILTFALIIGYFLPTLIASHAKKRNTTAIALLNIFLGWSILGWIIALVWATTKDQSK